MGGFPRAGRGEPRAYAAMTAWLARGRLRYRLAEGAAGFRALAVHGLALVFWVVGAPLWLAGSPPRCPRSAVLAVGWVVLLPTFLALVQLRKHGHRER